MSDVWWRYVDDFHNNQNFVLIDFFISFDLSPTKDMPLNFEIFTAMKCKNRTDKAKWGTKEGTLEYYTKKGEKLRWVSTVFF